MEFRSLDNTCLEMQGNGTKRPRQLDNPMPTVDLSFQIVATQPIPADHGYHLYAALSKTLPVLHQHNGIAVHPIPRDTDRRPHAAAR